MASDDSFDDLLASMDIPSEAKKIRLTPVKQQPTQSSNSIVNNVINDGTNVPASEATTSKAGAPTSSPIKKSATSQHHIIVHPKQRGNPLLKSITNCPWEFDEIVPDYIVGVTTCVLFLSLRYHNLNPDYIHNRLKLLGKSFELRVLLVQVDTKDPHNALKHLTRICFLADLTLMLAWNAEEAGKMIETYKMFEKRSPELIMERAEQYPHQKLVGALTNIKPVNKTDAMTLLQNYGSLANLINSSEGQLSLCAGLGPRKAQKLYKTFNEPFLKK